MLTRSTRLRLAIEIKLSSAPTLPAGMPRAIGATRGFVVMPEGERFPLSASIEAIALTDLVSDLESLL